MPAGPPPSRPSHPAAPPAGTSPTAEPLDLTVRTAGPGAGAHRLHGQRFGSPSAPLVLCVHGLTGNGTAFDGIGARLGGADLQLVALDLRGRGRSDTTPPGTYGWESHARDLFAVADALGAERFGVIGVSMGASVAMKAAELDGRRLTAVVLVDTAGRVDRGVGPVVDAIVRQVRSGADPAAVAEDRAYTATQDPYARWRHLTMPTLLLRATRELAPGAGHVVPADDRDRFHREVPGAQVVEIDASHVTILDHPETPAAVGGFLRAAGGG